jgi:anti-anti-sigma regulatory factor
VIPYRLNGGDGAVRTIQVNVVAMDARKAAEDATLIAQHWLRIRGLPTNIILNERISTGSPSKESGGPHFLIFADNDIVHSVCFPSRIDSVPGERMGDILNGFDPKQIDAVVFSCAELTYINTVGLTSIAAHVKRLRIHLYQVPEPVLKVFEIVGLSRYITIMPGLEEALVAIPARP